MAATDLTFPRLRAVVSYNARTGIFFWVARPANCIRVGDRAGTLSKTHGYRAIQIDGTVILEHRLAIFYSTGFMPSVEVDHINGDRADNRLRNLRLAGKAWNMQNKRSAQSNNVAGMLGAYFNKNTGTYTSKIGVDKRQIYLGCYSTPEEAHAAYVKAKRILHPAGTI